MIVINFISFVRNSRSERVSIIDRDKIQIQQSGVSIGVSLVLQS